MLCENRTAAARRLAERLAAYRCRNALVLAIPRGAVPMGKIIADDVTAIPREAARDANTPTPAGGGRR